MSDYRLFDVTGIELEYAIVDQASLRVRPIADEVLRAAAGEITGEVERGAIAWSNELALHVLELKTNGPVARLDGGLRDAFQGEVAAINGILAAHGACLMPTAMHPWMDPDNELRLWPHDSDVIYRTFDRIFNCRGHGWANLQSCHVNLPFSGDEEFGRLHAAIRLLLPLLPALAASSPVADGRRQAFADFRLEVYRHNSERVPSVAGAVVPEPVFTRGDYERGVLRRIYDDLAGLDPEGVLRHEWVNSRGCIARFDRGSIEIRILDVQEHPAADLAVAAAVRRVLEDLVAERPCAWADQRAWDTTRLRAVFDATVRAGSEAQLEDPEYLAALGYTGRSRRAADVWNALLGGDVPPPMALILEQGCLSRRILGALGDVPEGARPDPERLRAVYERLCQCLARGESFRAADLG